MITKVRYTFVTRIRSLRGETLAETLVAILVASLAMIMLANAIGIAQNIVGRGRVAANEQYEAETALVTMTGKQKQVKVTLTGVNGSSVAESPESQGRVYVLWRELEVPGSYTVVSYEPM